MWTFIFIYDILIRGLCEEQDVIDVFLSVVWDKELSIPYYKVHKCFIGLCDTERIFKNQVFHQRDDVI